jgi:hypothetical protein
MRADLPLYARLAEANRRDEAADAGGKVRNAPNLIFGHGSPRNFWLITKPFVAKGGDGS